MPSTKDDINKAKNLYLSGKIVESIDLLKSYGISTSDIEKHSGEWKEEFKEKQPKVSGLKRFEKKQEIVKKPSQLILPEAKPSEQLELPGFERVRAGSKEAGEELVRLREESAKKREEEFKKEQETKERLARLGLLPPSTSIEEAKKKPATERPSIGGPPTPPTEGKPPKEEERGNGEIKGTVLDASNNKPLEDVEVVALAPGTARGFYDIETTDDKGEYSLNAPGGRRHRLQASKSGYKTGLVLSPEVKTGETVQADTIKLKPEKEEKEKRGWFKKGEPPKKSIKEKVLTGGIQTKTGLGFAIGLSLFLVVLYWIFAGKILGMVGLQASTLIIIAGTIVIFLLVFFGTRGRGIGGMLKVLLPLLGLFILIYFIFGFRSFANLTDMEWYLSRLDLLKAVGLPSATVDNVKAGIRNALSFLFKEKEVIEKPVAEKIGSWQALDVKFGSKYRDYKLPILYANDTIGYFLPVTISNPNTVESGMVVKEFWIRSNDCINNDCSRPDPYEGDASIDTTDGFKLMCGFADGCSNSKKEKCKIEPQMEKEITLSFKHGFEDGNVKERCDTLIDDIYQTIEYVPTPTFGQIPTEEECKKRCGYRGLTYVSPQFPDSCLCKVKGGRMANNFTELCLNSFNESIQMSGEVEVEFISGFSFNVEGNSEFFILQKEADKKFLPKPKITTSSGPLGITVWFAPSFWSLDKIGITGIRMFIDIENKGGGSAKIDEQTVSIIVPNNPALDKLFTDCLEIMKRYAGGKLIINRGEEKEILCSLKTSDLPDVTGTYVTIPINVKMGYTYSQLYEQTIPIFKKVPLEEEKYLIGLPGYCAKGVKP